MSREASLSTGLPGVHVGCSGWQYKHWRGNFYPAGLPASRWLGYYTTRFNTVEINNSFYRLPEPAHFAKWRAAASGSFVFAVKASRYITHAKKLKDAKEPVDRLFSHAASLGRSLGPALYQLPPGWRLDLSRLKAFLTALPARRRHAIEFRDPSWYVDPVFTALERRGVALCLHDMTGSATSRERVGPFVYVRFHGVTKYSGRYTDDRLADWAEWCARCLDRGIPVYAYFNNDVGGHAPRDAARLRQFIATARQTGASTTGRGLNMERERRHP